MTKRQLKNKPHPRTGADGFHYAVLEDDPAGGLPLYAASVEVPGFASGGYNQNANTNSYYADNGVYETATQTGDLTATVQIADLTPEISHDLFGHEYKDGLLLEGLVNAKDIAIGWRVKKANGKYRYFWHTKGKAAPPAETTNTQGNNVSFQDVTVTVACSMLASLGIARRVLDDDDANLPEGTTPEIIAENWFKDPLWKPVEIIHAPPVEPPGY